MPGSGTGGPGRRRLYGRRQGHRLRPARRALLADMLDAVRIRLPKEGPLDPAMLFPGGRRPIWLEIGFGSGEHMAELAERHPEVGFVGCEPFVNGVSAALREIADRNLGNVRIFDDDARLLLDRLPEGSLERVYLLFPDPWPKKRHHRRRFLDAGNLRLLAGLLRPGGLLQVATDHMECGRWMLANALREPAFEWLAESAADWKERPAGEPPTRYEGKALSRGSPCHYFRFRRREGA